MTDTIDRTVTHASFTLTRSLTSAPTRVFAAFADKERKAKWFGDPSQTGGIWDFDFREGGLERNSGDFHGHLSSFEAVYHDIIPNARIVFSYTMFVDGVKLSASLSTIEFEPQGEGTLLVHTEHGAFFDGHEDPKQRELGTVQILEALAAAVDGD